MNRLLVIVFLLINSCFSVTTFGQDTLSLFYATAKYRLTDDHQTQLNYFLDLHDVGLVDSIQIIGVADSSGNAVSNQRLSLRRASHVESFFQDHSVENKMVLLAKGEDPNLLSVLQKQRRVDIIFFYPGVRSDISLTELEEEDLSDSSCYTSADFILNHCFQTVIQKGNKTYVQLELDPVHYSESIHVYSMVEDQKTGFPILRLVKWKSNLSGEDWWRKKRFVATIKKEDFDRFKIVKKSDKPCDSLNEGCGFKLTDKNIKLKYGNYLDLAYFLMNNLQIKRKFFNRKMIRIEAPRKYVINYQFFLDPKGELPIVWYSKWWRKRRSSSFADIPLKLLKNDKLAIYTYFGRSSCDSGSVQFGCINLPGMGSSISFGFELGDRILTPNHFGYVGMYGKCAFRSSEFDVLLGIDTDWDPFISARFDYHFIGLNQNGFLRNPAVYSQNLFGLYGGTTLDVIAPDVKRLTANQDLHLGLDFTLSYSNKPIHRIYLEAGPMIQYANLLEPISMQYRLGIQFKF